MTDTESVAHQCEQRRWGKLQWLISQCTKMPVPGSSSAQATCGLQFPNWCTLRFCTVVRLSIGPVDDVGSVTKIYENLEGHAVLWRFMNHTEQKPPCWLINDDFLDSVLRSLKCQRRRKHIGKKTWSVTIVIFVRTGSQDWTQSVITSENSYSFMIFQPGVHQTVFDSQQLQRTFWLSRTLPSNFFSTKRVAKNSESKAEGKWRGHSNWKKKQGVLISTYLVFKPTWLFWAHEVNTSRKPTPTNFRNTMNMGLWSLSRSINGQDPNRSGRSSVSTWMLLLPRSNSHLLRLDLESHRSGAFVAQIGAPTMWYRDLDPWT